MNEEARRYLKHAVMHLIDAQSYIKHAVLAEPYVLNREEVSEINTRLLSLIREVQTAINRT